MARTRRYELGVGVLLAAALVLLGWMALEVGAIDSLGPTVDVTLRLKDAAGLQSGASVVVAGVPVGRIERLGLDHATAIALLSLDPDAELRRDVAVRVRARSILGEKVLELVPGSTDAPLLVDGDVLVLDRAQTEIDELVDRIGPLLAAIDPDALGAALDAVSKALAEDPDRVARMLRNADAILDDGAVAADKLPALLDRADATLDGVDRATASAYRRLEEAKPAVAKASAALDDLRAITEPGRALVEEARAAVGHADTVLAAFDGLGPDVHRIVKNVAEIDKWELRRLLREEGILIRLHPTEVAPTASP